jgi:hypothetical protein
MLNQFNKSRMLQTVNKFSKELTKAWIAVLLMTLMSLLASSCATSPTTINSNTTASANLNSNVATNANVMTEANTNSTGVSSAAFATKEPPQYSLTMVVSGQGSTTEKQSSLSPQTIEFARMDVDRRWAINVPSFGQIVYLEKPTMRYLILPSRNQYVELSPDALGFQLGNAMTPSAIIERLKPHAQTENLGAETVNGRAATKYRFVGEKDTRTQAGTVQSDSFVYVDDLTGLPLRADLNFSSSAGATARGTIETNNINLNPDVKLFEVPTTYKKVTAEELKQQVQSFIQFIRILAPAMTQQAGASTAPASQPAPTPGKR